MIRGRYKEKKGGKEKLEGELEKRRTQELSKSARKTRERENKGKGREENESK